MADLSDVTAALKAAIVALAYPNGASSPSALGVEIQVMEGWPLPKALDAICGKPNVSAAKPISIVSIFPVPQTTGDAATCMDMSGAVKSHAIPGLTISVEDDTVTLTGTAAGIENVVVIVNKAARYDVQAKVGDTAQTVATALFAQIEAALPGSTIDTSDPAAPTIDIAGAHTLTTRIGTTGIIQRTTHRERAQIRITVWSSNPVDRHTVGKPIDRMIKARVRFDLPDGTDSIITYSASNWSDDPERFGLYRRDIVFSATCDSIEEIEGVEVTAVGFQTSLPSSGATISTSA